MEIYDISQELLSSKVFKGDSSPRLQVMKTIEEGYRLSDLHMCLHNGTHIDAPSHFLPDGTNADSIDLNKCIGQCVVVRTNDPIDETVVNNIDQKFNRVLFDGKGLVTKEGAKRLVERNFVLVGIARVSIADMDNCTDVHTILFESGVVLIEGLVLKHISQGEYKLIALPLNISNAEASPVRAVLLGADD